MLKLLIRWAVGAAALYLTVLAGKALGIQLGLKDVGSAFIAVLALTLVNALIRPIVKLLTLPLNCLTFGLFSFVVNALMFWLVGQLGVGLYVGPGIVPPLFGSVVMSLIGGVLNTFIADKEDDRR